LDDLGVNMSEEHLIVQVKGNLRDWLERRSRYLTYLAGNLRNHRMIKYFMLMVLTLAVVVQTLTALSHRNESGNWRESERMEISY
jgi:hypothetical protein